MIFAFNHKEIMTAMLMAGELQSAKQTETLDGFTRLDFTVDLSAKDKMVDAEFVAHKDPNDPEFFYMYKIVSAKNSDEGIAYTAVNIAFDELKGYGYLREYRMEKTTAPLALDTILHGSRWRAGKTEQTGQSDFYIYDLTRLDAINKLVAHFGVDLLFRITINGNQITGRYVDLYQQRGSDTGLRFYYGKNALDVVREEDQQDIFTAVIGRGKGEEKFDDTGESTGGFGRKINFKEVEWIKGEPVAEDDPMYGICETYPLDKPKDSEYIELPEATEEYGYSDGTARYKIITHEKITDPKALVWACYKDLMAGARPLVHFKTNVERAGNLGIGDVVRIIREDLDIYYSARVFKVVRDLLAPDMTTIELGDNLEYKQGLKNRDFTSSISSLGERVSEVATSTHYTFNAVIKDLREGLENSYYNNDGYNYELKAGNPYKLPAGYYSFNAPIDENPTKVIYMGAGMMAIANKKKNDGTWDWQTFGTGDGLLAETIIGTLGEFARVNANQINVSDDFATTALGKKVVVQDTLYNNVKITGAKGIQVLDAQSRERVQLGNWAYGRYGLKLTDPSGNRTILDDQGMLQSWQDGRCDNIDDGHPLNLRLYIPQETARIYTAKLRLYIEKYRAFSKGMRGGGYKSSTTGGGGYKAVRDTSGGGGGTTTDTGSSGINVNWVEAHTYGPSAGASHYHTFDRVDSHQHRITLNDHYHSVSFDIPDHYHPFTVDSHEHELLFGIYEEWNYADRLEVYINGIDRTAAIAGSGYITGNESDMDIAAYISKGWNTISIRARSRARVDATVFLQCLQYFGG